MFQHTYRMLRINVAFKTEKQIEFSWMLLRILCIVGVVRALFPGTNGNLRDNPKLRDEVELEARQYLYRFGYVAPLKTTNDEGKSIAVTKEDLHLALLKFQKEFLYYRSGVVDVPTQAKFAEYRCANKDMHRGHKLRDLPKSELWEKKTLTWNITSFPSLLTESETREACHEAFEKWRKATGFNFFESKNADIVIHFQDIPNPFLNVAGTASGPKYSHIVFDKNRLWGYRNHIPQGVSLYHSLLHEIGHVLGLHHTFYRGSIMYPILWPALVPYGALDNVPNFDIISFRKLYGLAQLPVDHTLSPDLSGPQKCPKFLDSVTAVNDETWLLFRGDKVWRVKDKKFADGGRKIQDVFPKGPEFVNATVSSHGLVLLFTERTIYGYEFDGVSFSEARDFPRELHDRVLFYPQGSFPMNNGSVVLLSGNVFATYDVVRNEPTFLNDKNRFFPNLPVDFRSGFPKDSRSGEEYWMFDESTVSGYNMDTKQITQLEGLTDFIKC